MTLAVSDDIVFESFNFFAVPNLEWQTNSACLGDSNPDAWADANKQLKAERERALAVCGSCTVQYECHKAGLSLKQEQVVTGMIWGGEVLR